MYVVVPVLLLLLLLPVLVLLLLLLLLFSDAGRWFWPLKPVATRRTTGTRRIQKIQSEHFCLAASLPS